MKQGMLKFGTCPLCGEEGEHDAAEGALYFEFDGALIIDGKDYVDWRIGVDCDCPITSVVKWIFDNALQAQVIEFSVHPGGSGSIKDYTVNKNGMYSMSYWYTYPALDGRLGGQTIRKTEMGTWSPGDHSFPKW